MKLDSYNTLDFAAGLDAGAYTFEFYFENLIDERAQISGNYVNDRARITTNRPTTFGMRFYDF